MSGKRKHISGCATEINRPCNCEPDPMTTPTTDAREREARLAALDLTVAERSVLIAKMPLALDRYRTAILATERARVRAVVEGERREPEKRAAVNIAEGCSWRTGGEL